METALGNFIGLCLLLLGGRQFFMLVFCDKITFKRVATGLAGLGIIGSQAMAGTEYHAPATVLFSALTMAAHVLINGGNGDV